MAQCSIASKHGIVCHSIACSAWHVARKIPIVADDDYSDALLTHLYGDIRRCCVNHSSDASRDYDMEMQLNLKSQPRTAAMRDKQAQQTPPSCPWHALGAASAALLAACW